MGNFDRFIEISTVTRQRPALMSRARRLTCAWLTASLRRRLDWLEKFAAIHTSPDGATINALA
jgi:hypothetical protein